MNKKQVKQELKKIKKILTSPKTKKAVKKHLAFWDKTFNNLGDSIYKGLGVDKYTDEERYQPILVINKYYLRVK